MILLVNAGLLLFLAFATLAYGVALDRQADACVPNPENATAPDCERPRVLSDATIGVARFLLAGGILLLGVGVASGWIRPKPPL